MMYIHYCAACQRVHILNGHKSLCPTCDRKLAELPISYMEYIEMNLDERKDYQERLQRSTNLV